ncbi:MAG: DUF481 domain-containing protein [Planctomycetota bacterium]|jgi:hypothetical protein
MERLLRLSLIALALGAAACASSKAKEEAEKAAKTKVTPWEPTEPGEPAEPPVRDDKGWDWIQLTSKEWLKGEMRSLRDETLDFDSDELDDLLLQWRKVAKLRTPRLMTVLRGIEDGDVEESKGTVLVRDGKVVVGREEGNLVFDRDDLITIVPGGTGRFNYWSGKLSIGATIRQGNTDQVDANLTFRLRRRAPKNRQSLDYVGNFGKLNGVENVNNQRLTGSWDIFTSRRWFITPFGFELFRDPFTNIDLRTTPAAGGGYHLFLKGLDRKGIDWDLTLLIGYRITEFSSGSGPREETATLVPGTKIAWDVTEKLELDFKWDLQLGLEDVENTNSNLELTLSYDLLKDLDLDISFLWYYVGKPRPNDDGTFPDSNDFRLIVGIGWDF